MGPRRRMLRVHVGAKFRRTIASDSGPRPGDRPMDFLQKHVELTPNRRQGEPLEILPRHTANSDPVLPEKQRVRADRHDEDQDLGLGPTRDVGDGVNDRHGKF